MRYVCYVCVGFVEHGGVLCEISCVVRVHWVLSLFSPVIFESYLEVFPC